MPELPEVETVRRGLAPHLTGARIEKVTLNRPDLRFPFPYDFAERLTGQTIANVNRRAKYLLFELGSGTTWLTHLGMTGNFMIGDAPVQSPSRYRTPAPGKHDHLQMLVRAPHEQHLSLTYTDPRRFGFMDLFDNQADCTFLNTLGPEPLGNELSAQYLATRFANRKTPIKSALLDQRNIAGLGNIYVCEALWRSGIAPTALAGKLATKTGKPTKELEALTIAIRNVLDAAITAGGSTLKDFKNADGDSGYFQHSFDVYDREGGDCHTPECRGTIARIVQSGRSSFYCPTCQK